MNDNPTPAGFSAFISHASQDREVASKVCEHLEAAGFRCWIAPRDVRPGQDYPAEIIRGIELSKSLVLILSKSANDSSFVRAEVERAYSKGKPIFPMRVEEVMPARSLELFISTKHWIDAWKGNLSDHAIRLARELVEDADLDISPELRRRFRLQRYLPAVAVFGGMAVMAAIVAYLMQPKLDASKIDITKLDLHASRPATAFFLGTMVRAGEPVRATFMLNDGWNGKGEVYNAFDNIKSFEVYEIAADASLKRLFAADPAQFKGQFRSTKTYPFEFSGLPKKVVACISYRIADQNRDEISIQAFNFSAPESSFASFGSNEAANFKVYDGRGASDCSKPVFDYAKEQLKLSVHAN